MNKLEQAERLKEVEEYLRDCVNSPVMAAKVSAMREALAEQAEQEPVALDEARRIAAEYAEPNSQVDSGNLYWALCEALQHIDQSNHVKQEPVAWEVLRKTKTGDNIDEWQYIEGWNDALDIAEQTFNPQIPELQAAPQPVKQEPVAYRIPSAAIGRWNYVNNIDGEEERFKSAWQPLYAAPVHTKDLTEDEIEEALVYRTIGWAANARAVIAAYKEKNK